MTKMIYLENTKFLNCIGTLLIVFLLLISSSCEDFVEVASPNTQLITKEVFANDATATAAVLGIYHQMTDNFNSIFNGQLTYYAGMSADELYNTSGSLSRDEFLNSSISAANPDLKKDFWDAAYKYIYQANSVIEGLNNSSTTGESVKRQLEGEAKFMRAFCHLYLTNLFGPIPYANTTNFAVNSTASRMLEEMVYKNIIDDLKDAQSLLDENYFAANNTPTSERVRPNKSVATALLARVYLYVGDWVNSEEQATAIIGNSERYGLVTDLNSVFLKNSTEAIWQLIPVIVGQNTAEGFRFAQTTGVPTFASLSDALVTSFESGDKRFINWIKSYSASGKMYYLPNKYKVKTATTVTEYYVVLRLAEQYLIRAEARAQQGKIPEAIADLDIIRKRANVTPIQTQNPSIDKPALLIAIERERRVEMFVEWGHRWLDLRRNDRADHILSVFKGTNWQSTDVLYPIPEAELLTNTKLLPQNLGY